MPTGYVTLTATGGYSSGQIQLSGGTTKITILGNTLSAGTVTLTATYGGDAVYAAGTNTKTVTVTQSVYSLSASTPASVSPGASATSTISGASSTYYTGTVTINSCSLSSSSVSNPSAPPTCSASGTITFSSGTPSGTGTATVSTYDETSDNLARPKLPGGGNKGWLGAGSGAVLALLVFFGIPARRRSWRGMLSILIVMAAIGTLASCGGGSSSGGGGGSSYITQAGTYTFTVQGAGNDPASTQETTTFTVTVN